MNFTCFEELSDLDHTALLVALIGAALILAIGLMLSFRWELWQKLAVITHEKFGVKIPPPLLCILICFVVLAGIYWYLNKQYPADGIVFDAKPWTLMEIKQRLEAVSSVDVQLKGDVASFAIDRRISGACASDVLHELNGFYRDQLMFHWEPGRVVIERKP